jgi:rRNA maturation endonuclease Nob1
MNEPQRFVLDTSALIQHPEILARSGRRKLVIPEAVLRELSGRGREESRNAITKLVQQAVARGAHVVPSPARLEQELLADDRGAKRLSGADIDIVRIAIKYAERFSPQSVIVVTLDRVLQDVLSSRGIKSLTGSQFLQEFSTEAPDPEIERSAQSFVAKQWRFAAFSVLLGFVSSFLGNLVFSRLSYLVATISVWGTVIALPVLGVVLYWYRQKFRLSYGIFEFLVGVMMTYYVFFPAFSYAKLTVVEGMQILGGLYVMVRGLDNVSKGIEGTRAEALWKKWFS